MGKIDKYIRDNCILSDKPVTGSSYITPDGKFVDLVNSGFRSHGALDERMLEDEVITLDELMGKTATPIRFENYVRVNDGKNFFSELVIDLPKNKLSIDQIYGIVDWLDFLIENHKDYVTIGSDLRGIRPVTYYFSETSTEDILKRIRRFQSSGTLYESVGLVEKIVYRGETDRTFSKTKKAFAGLFFGPTKASVKGWGTPVKYKLSNTAKIFEYSSSDAYCGDNGLYNKEYKELSVFSEYADIKSLSYFTNLKEEERKELNTKVEQIAGKIFCWYDLWTWCLQLVAKIELEKKGYDGAFWQFEDAGNPKQYQIWNMSVISRCQNENINEDLVSVNAVVFNSTDTKLDAICKEYEGCKFIPMKRDACMAINRQMIYYLNEKGYYDIKIVGGLFKVDKLDWVDKNDFSKSEIAEIYQTYGNTTKASLLKYLESLPEEKRVEFYYIPHWWCELPDGTIVDAAWRMFKKYINNVSIDNYVEFENITDLQSYCGNNVKNLKTSKYIIGKKSQDLVESSKEIEYNIIEGKKKKKEPSAWIDLDAAKHAMGKSNTLYWYVSPAGNKPAEKFFDACDIDVQIKFANLFELLAANRLHEVKDASKQLDSKDKIYELRVQDGELWYRITYFRAKEGPIILTGFYKNSNKTLPVEIEKARQCVKNYNKYKLIEEVKIWE